MNAWSDGGAGIQFAYSPNQPDVRITFMDDGYWSYLGTDVHQIPRGDPTMCLQGFTMSTSEAEYRRVVRHETGHTLGFVHEHMRKELVAPDRPEPGLACISSAPRTGTRRPSTSRC